MREKGRHEKRRIFMSRYVFVRVNDDITSIKRLKENGEFELIRRAETPNDYFATFDCFDILKNMKNPYEV